MEYKIYQFEFTTGVHFGERSLEDAGCTVLADTLFSALCQEAVKRGEKELEVFVRKAEEGRIQFSDSFPYIGDTYYLPKPMMKVESEEKKGDSVLKKAYKKLNYVPADKFEEYLEGKLDVRKESGKIRDLLGSRMIRTSAAVRGEEETRPYRVGIYYFRPESGLYLILGYQQKEDMDLAEEYLSSLALSGIGGKRSAGLGKFDLKYGKMPKEMRERLDPERASSYMSLSVSLPRDEELESALGQASYAMIKRSGFVLSGAYAPEQRRKRDLFAIQAGSCFRNRFEGNIYDVSEGGAHPVYRYAKPMFWEVMA